MGAKDVGLAVVMTLSSIVLTYKWLARFGDSDPVIIISAMLLAGSLVINTRTTTYPVQPPAWVVCLLGSYRIFGSQD